MELNNREIILLVWSGIALLGVLCINGVRAQLPSLIKTALQPVLLRPVLLLAGYVAVLIFLGSRIGIWRPDLLFDTAMWFFVVALAMFLKAYQLPAGASLTRISLKRAAGLAVFIEVFVNLVVFSLVVEFFLLALVSLLVLLSAVAATDKKTKEAHRWIDGVITAIGFILLASVLFHIFFDWGDLDKTHALLAFALPVWLTLGLLPILWPVSIVSGYGSMFRWVNFATEDRRARLRAKLALVSTLYLRVRKVQPLNSPDIRVVLNEPSLSTARSAVRRLSVSSEAAGQTA